MQQTEKQVKKRIIGLMSGTSLDGIDLVCVDFWKQNDRFHYDFVATDCVSYSPELQKTLRNAHLLSATELMALDAAFGNFLGQHVNDFISEFNLKNIDFIASHGHTVFHAPEAGYTFQIGHGAHLNAETNIKVICDFRAQDVALGGQGAPLVPVGDKLLFNEFQACVNLGGFANISLDDQGKRIAFDICPVNFVLNHLAQKTGNAFDENGEIARNSEVDEKLLLRLNNLKFYNLPFPKSLGREWVEREIFPLLDEFDISNQDKIATFTHHAAAQIAQTLDSFNIQNALFSGGGALNGFLMELISAQSKCVVHKADNRILHFKEALIFAFLGYLKSENRPNIFASVTGSVRDHSAGIVYE